MRLKDVHLTTAAMTMIMHTSQAAPTQDEHAIAQPFGKHDGLIPGAASIMPGPRIPLMPEDHRYPMIGVVIFHLRERESICTGTLVGRRTVLTAEHCITTALSQAVPEEGVMEIIFSPNFNGLILDSDGQLNIPVESRSKVTSVIRGNVNENDTDINRAYEKHHLDPANIILPGGNATLTCPWQYSDWAILVLEEPLGDVFGFMDVGSLSEKDTGKEASFSLVGYGPDRNDTAARKNPINFTPHIQEVFTTVDAIGTCWTKAPQSQGVARVLANVYEGDSGGPLFQSNETGNARHVVFGVISTDGPVPNLNEAIISWGESIVKTVEETNAAHP